MQKKSIYNDKYQPMFIQEMDESKLKEFSKILSQKLRHVKLAISKAALGQNKYANFEVNDSQIKDKSKKEKNLVKTKHKTGKNRLQPLNFGGGLNSYMDRFDLNPKEILQIFQENKLEVD